MAKQWRSAIVGVGVVGEWHLRLLTQMNDQANLVALCDIDPDKAKQKLEKHNLLDRGIKVYASQEQMHQNEQIEVAHICTPSGDHMGPAIRAMDAGCNVISEKPVEIQLDRIDKMIAHAKSCKVKLAGIFQNRWNAANKAIKDAADAGRFGTLAFGGCYTPWYRSDEYYREGGWRGTWALDGGGAIMNQSVHAVDLIQWIMGPVKSVSAHASSRIHAEIEVEDTLACSLTYKNGAHGIIMGSTAMWPGSGVRIEVGGENGTAMSEGGLRTYRFRDEKPEDKQLLESLNKKQATSGGGSSNVDVGLELHHANISAIYSAWEAGQEAATNGTEARKAVAIILAMYESARKGGVPIEVD